MIFYFWVGSSVFKNEILLGMLKESIDEQWNAIERAIRVWQLHAEPSHGKSDVWDAIDVVCVVSVPD